MSILGKIRRTNSTFITIVIFLLAILLVASHFNIKGIIDFLNIQILGNVKNCIGMVAGEKISHEEYHKLCESEIASFKHRIGNQLTNEQTMRCRGNAWNQLVVSKLLHKEEKQLGIAVGANELTDLIEGDHIDPFIKILQSAPEFTNPETGVFDKQKFLEFKKEHPLWWPRVEQFLASNRALKKIYPLITKSSFFTLLEKEHLTRYSQMYCDVDYLYIPFNTISDDLIPVFEDHQLKEYMASHSAHYTSPGEVRVIKYLAFPIDPDEKDREKFQSDLSAITAGFATAADAYDFAKQHTEGNEKDIKLECGQDELPDHLASIRHTLKKDMIVGPIVEGEFHTLYRVMAINKEEKSYYYQFAVIERKISTSDQTRKQCLEKAKRFASQVKNLNDFAELAKKEKMVILQEKIYPSTIFIDNYGSVREVVRWLYTEAKYNKVSPVFDVGEAYLLAVMVGQAKAGDLLPLDTVRGAVAGKMINQAKAELILDKLNRIQASTLQEIAKQYGNNSIEVDTVESVNPLETSFKLSPACIGRCMSLSIGSVSLPIVDEKGIFMVYVKKRYDREKTPEELEKFIQETKDKNSYLFEYLLWESLKELGNVIDRRYKYE